ncbi:MAG: molybdopterin converting factor [Phycisphaerae bacterium]|nr:molybdopterin converting factor [Phycisphaerae bacterium]
MKIMFINNSGAGFADYLVIGNDTSIEALFQQKLPHEETTDYLIRVNRQPVPKDYILQENDRVTITPLKIDGARPV